MPLSFPDGDRSVLKRLPHVQVAGLVHDLGKLLYIFGSEYVVLSSSLLQSYADVVSRGQWDVVGVCQPNFQP